MVEVAAVSDGGDLSVGSTTTLAAGGGPELDAELVMATVTDLGGEGGKAGGGASGGREDDRWALAAVDAWLRWRGAKEGCH